MAVSNEARFNLGAVLLTDDCVDASELLEDLNTASDEEASPGLDGIFADDILPPSLARVLICDCLGDDSVQALHLEIIQVVRTLDTS